MDKILCKVLEFNITRYKMLEQNGKVEVLGINVPVPSFNLHSSTNYVVRASYSAGVGEI